MTADDATFIQAVRRRAARKLAALRAGPPPALSGLGAFGIIGWSVAVPTLLGVLLGRAIDQHWPGPHSWTLALLIAGVVLGCANAWHSAFREAAITATPPSKPHDD